MDSISLAIDLLKWLLKKMASKLGFKLGEFEQNLGAIFVLLLVIFCVGIIIRFMVNV